MHNLYWFLLTGFLTILTATQPTASSKRKVLPPRNELPWGVPEDGVTCATSKENPNRIYGATMALAITRSVEKDLGWHQQHPDANPPGTFSNDQIGTDPNGDKYTIVWAPSCDPTDSTRPILSKPVGEHDFVLYQVTWQTDSSSPTFTGRYCAVVTNSDATASELDSITLAGVHQCNDN